MRKGPVVDERLAELEQAVSASALLGYLNYAEGRVDPRWQKQLNEAYAFLAQNGHPTPWTTLLDWLRGRLRQLHASGASAFSNVTQADEVLALIPQVLSAYRTHHADLLAHLDDRDVFCPFFLARVSEAILARRTAGGAGDLV